MWSQTTVNSIYSFLKAAIVSYYDRNFLTLRSFLQKCHLVTDEAEENECLVNAAYIININALLSWKEMLKRERASSASHCPCAPSEPWTAPLTESWAFLQQHRVPQMLCANAHTHTYTHLIKVLSLAVSQLLTVGASRWCCRSPNVKPLS